MINFYGKPNDEIFFNTIKDFLGNVDKVKKV